MATIKNLKRMCDSYISCFNCPIESTHVCNVYRFPGNIEEVVDKWVSEHPVKTYSMDFFEKFPNAPRNIDGSPKACRESIYGDGKVCLSDECTKCWNSEINVNT